MSYNYEILGQSANPAFAYPYDVALDINRNVYVADYYNDALRKIDTSGTVTTIGTFNFPSGVATCVPANAGGVTYTYLVGGGGNTAYLQCVNTDTGAAIDFSSSINFDYGVSSISVSCNTDGTLVYVARSDGTGSLITLCQVYISDPTSPTSNVVVTSWTTNPQFSIYGISLDKTTGFVYVTHFGDGSIYSIDPSQGNGATFTLVQQLTSDNISSIFVENSTSIYVSTPTSLTISRCNGSTYTTISANYAPQFVPNGLSVDSTGNIYVADIGNNQIVKLALQNVVCFKEGAKILTDVGYKPIETLKKGDLVKTLTKGFVPIEMIGQKKMHNSASNYRVAEQLYICTQEFYPEVFEPLIITGCHSILVDAFENDQQREEVSEVLGNIYVTEGKYRLPACVDERSKVYLEKGDFTIYHMALENENYYGNYGVFANGLLVETCSRRYLKELANMTLLD